MHVITYATHEERYLPLLKKIKEEPNSAVVGKLRALSMAPVINITSAKTDIFSADHVLISKILGKR